MTSYASDIIDQVVDRLAASLPQLQVEACPGNLSFWPLEHPLGAVFVLYNGSTWSEPEALGIIVQQRTVSLGISLLLRSLTGQQGACALVEAIRLVLTGLALEGTGCRIYPVTDSFYSANDGIWRYDLTFVVNIPALENQDEDIMPLLRRATFSGDDGTTVVSSEA